MFFFFLCNCSGHAIKSPDFDSSLEIVERPGAAIERLNSLFAKAAMPAKEHFCHLFLSFQHAHRFSFLQKGKESQDHAYFGQVGEWLTL